MNHINQYIGVSVIIPCRNEEKYIEKCIYSIIQGTTDNIDIEILVVDGMSTDNTKHIVKKISAQYPFVKLIENYQKETQFGLNEGIRNSVMPYVMISGAHSEYTTNYLQNLLIEMDKLGADGVGGSIITKSTGNTKSSSAIKIILAHPFGVGNSMFRIGATAPIKVDTVPFGIYKRQLFDEVGLYNERLKRNHDIEWSKRVLKSGKSVWLIPHIKCNYYARETYKTIASNNYLNGLWNILTVFITRNFNALSLRHFVPFFFVSSLIITALSSLLFPPLIFINLTILTIYIIALLFITIKTDRKETSFLHLLWGFIVLHFSYGIGSIIGFFIGIFLLPKK